MQTFYKKILLQQFLTDMQNFQDDNRTVMTLDAGGTNFVFSAMRGYEEVVTPVVQPASPDNLEACLDNVIDGFKQVEASLDEKPDAISFAFPGPADYRRGIIGNPPNFPAFEGYTALGPMLEKEFEIPVFINNDGGLFTLGEAVCGMLPRVNNLLKEHGASKYYRNLIGVTIGTGLGGGIVIDGNLCTGDNSAGGEFWLLRNKLDPEMCAEEGVSIRAIKRNYKFASGVESTPDPKSIYEIGIGKKDGDKKAARKAYQLLGETLGDVLANTVTLIDGLIVIGGGLAGAKDLFLPTLIEEMNSSFSTSTGDTVSRLDLKVYNLENDKSRSDFLQDRREMISIPRSGDIAAIEVEKKVAVGISNLGTNRAVAVGAYQMALKNLRNLQQEY